MSILVLQLSWLGRMSWLLCLICLPGVSWWLSGSSSRCHGVVCGLWLLYFLIILTYYFRISKVLLYIVLNRKCLNRCKNTIQDLYTSTKSYMYKSYCYAAWCIYVFPYGTWNALCYFDQVFFYLNCVLWLLNTPWEQVFTYLYLVTCTV